MPILLTASEISDRLKKTPEWDCDQKQLERTHEFEDFAQAIDFVNSVAEIAEELGHHPDIDIRWNKVRLAISTHSKGGLTEFDFALAGKIDHLADEV